LDAIRARVAKENNLKKVTDARLAKEIGVTQSGLNVYRKGELTARQIIGLMDRAAAIAEKKLVARAVVPIVEFLELDSIETRQGKSMQLFSDHDENGIVHPFYEGLKSRLENNHGIYIFHDSRGQAIYVGKAQTQSLWKEMNSAFNRGRKKVQSIKRVNHPLNRKNYNLDLELRRKITKQPVILYDIASYMSAYEVPNRLIGKFEALLVRSFANDLLNVKMENF